MSEVARQKFQNLLRELFQFDLADLDFGIYRIMNHKRQVIERWIVEDLPKAVEEELRRGALAEQAQAQQALEGARQKVVETLGREALDAEGNLAEQFAGTKVGREYLEARERAAHAQPSEALEAAIYNHLYTFFSRYYQDGDFISKRRYSKRQKYAIPYNGEEVYLYWANHDQYYIKTAEHFTDYTWKAPGGVTVHFKLQAADVEVNNVKGEKRFFLPALDGMAWDAETRTLTIPFHYRPLTEQEKITYGNKNQQEKILEEAMQAIPARLQGNTEALAALTAERRKDAKGNPVSYLEHHLRQYTARNTRDFFIHKDLRGFLARELDFYIKNEVLNLEELEAAGEDLAEGWFQLMRLIKRVGNHIIDFLAQIEDFQKALWEKKKFITETFWCITVGHIPEEFYPEIAENEAQWQEWRELFHIHELPEDMFSGDPDTEEGRIAFLKAHPSLVLDTRHFSPDFTDHLLASFDNLDEMIDGLLVHSENWQALNLLLEKYRERVKCIYIDPPYNTGSDEFIYRDNYQHSSWLAMMENRLGSSRILLAPDGLAFVHIDEREQPRLESLMQQIFGNSLGPFIWLARVGKAVTERVLQIKHEYVLCARATDNARLKLVEKKVIGRYEDERGRYNREQLRQWGGQHDRREDRPTMYFPIRTPFGVDVYPKRPDGSDGCWRASREEVEKMLEAGDLDFVRDPETGDIKVYRKVREGTVTVSAPSNILDDCGTSATATMEIKSLFLDKVFDTAKPVSLAQRCISLVAGNVDGVVLDYFAGSGTTGHAVINLNREDGGKRKFILVEMADYFDTVLLPRIKKVTFTPEWKDGKPKRLATQEEFERGPRIVKVIRLESYEDALNNITFDEESGQQALELFGDEYLLHYMLRWESRKSETFLDVEKLQSPFSYKLRIHRDGETREQPVDLPETFNYLLGLDVETRRVYNDDGRRYMVYRGITREGHKVVIIWRETKGWTQEDYERDAAFVAEQRMTEGADEVFVNGDSYIPGAQSLDGLFKARLFGQREG
ncbi:MAG: site-specific DNA-methyltransferase [Candidatus Verstraetearchaeota archaeon]|nr:site-specific DNA-methyltransferase [Candidatus Verstraetearchaeota archaeon]